MKSIAFPDIFNKNKTTTNLVEDYYATFQNLKMLLWSEKGELFGDPYYGTGLKKYLFDQNDTILQDILIDDIYNAIRLFMPQISVNRKDITLIVSRAKVSVKIQALNKADFTTDLYNIVLLDAAA